MLTLFENGVMRLGKIRVGEAAQRNGGQPGHCVIGVGDRTAALRAKAEARAGAAFSRADIFSRVAGQLHAVIGKAGLSGKGAAAASLAIDAMADGNAHRLPAAKGVELAAMAGCCTDHS